MTPAKLPTSAPGIRPRPHMSPRPVTLESKHPSAMRGSCPTNSRIPATMTILLAIDIFDMSKPLGFSILTPFEHT